MVDLERPVRRPSALTALYMLSLRTLEAISSQIASSLGVQSFFLEGDAFDCARQRHDGGECTKDLVMGNPPLEHCRSLQPCASPFEGRCVVDRVWLVLRVRLLLVCSGRRLWRMMLMKNKETYRADSYPLALYMLSARQG